ncbi:MAG: hypothetical protein IKP60_13835 [Treponema sp.]|nr:hypothetical protein [Treponema sp.]
MGKKKAILKIESYSTKDGILLLSVSDFGVRTMLKDLIELCQQKYGAYIQLELSPPYRKRTLPQNSRYWAKCTEYGLYCGMTKDEVSEGVKFRAMEEGLWRGKEVPFSKTGAKIPDSSATADTREMAILDEVLNRIAAEDGYVFEE